MGKVSFASSGFEGSLVLPVDKNSCYNFDAWITKYSLEINSGNIIGPNERVTRGAPSYATGSIEFISNGKVTLDIGGFHPRIRNKAVKDCSILELLYAVRVKAQGNGAVLGSNI